VHNAKAIEEATLISLYSNEQSYEIYIRNSDFICDDTPFVESKVIGDLSTIESRYSVYKCKIFKSLTNIDNSAFRGGVIKASNSKISITGSKFL
jgi:hypothetical protein